MRKKNKTKICLGTDKIMTPLDPISGNVRLPILTLVQVRVPTYLTGIITLRK